MEWEFGLELINLSSTNHSTIPVFYKMELVSYKVENNQYTANVKTTFYDHFGLDSSDINKYDWDGFEAWYTLQHAKRFNGQYKPFITVFSSNIVLTGNIS